MRPGRIIALLPLWWLGSSSTTAATKTTAHTLSQVETQINVFLEKQSHGVEDTQARYKSKFGCDVACGFLKFSQSHSLAYPNEAAYEDEEARYWSLQQATTRPKCRFTPHAAEQVAFAVLTLRVTQCEFAVKSGGHAAFSGASNINNGLTIDLANLKEVTVSQDKQQTSVGAGNVWYDVYTKLQPLGLTVIGGRVSAIGVGGLTLGGGVSFFSSLHGWACDNVDSFEVVFADGSIREVSYKSEYSDLYWALRGGGNNFGIVTRFNLATYPQGDLWAGTQAYLWTEDNGSAMNEAFYHFSINAPSDPNAQVITAYSYAQQYGKHVIASDLQYAKPVVNPPILRNFTSIPHPISDTLRVTDLSGLTQEFNNTNPNGFRQTYWTFTVENNKDLMDEMVAIYQSEVENIKACKGLVPSVIFQPITKSMMSHFKKQGGNPLGIHGPDPLNLINIAISWSDSSDDDRILTAAQNILDRSVAVAKAKGLYNRYLYQNYASPTQDVFPSYGKENLDRLRSISDKYDPAKVWQKLQPGYFKLS